MEGGDEDGQVKNQSAASTSKRIAAGSKTRWRKADGVSFHSGSQVKVLKRAARHSDQSGVIGNLVGDPATISSSADRPHSSVWMEQTLVSDESITTPEKLTDKPKAMLYSDILLNKVKPQSEKVVTTSLNANKAFEQVRARQILNEDAGFGAETAVMLDENGQPLSKRQQKLRASRNKPTANVNLADFLFTNISLKKPIGKVSVKALES